MGVVAPGIRGVIAVAGVGVSGALCGQFLSVPGMRGMVPRWNHIRYTGFDVFGDAIDRTVDGFHARVVQHECDHLWGKLYPMRMRDFSQFGFTDVLFPGISAAEDD